MSKGLIITPSINAVLQRLDDTETGIYLRWMLASYYGSPASLQSERENGPEVVDRIIRQAGEDIEIIDGKIIINPASAQRKKAEHISQVRAQAGRRSQAKQRQVETRKVVGLDNRNYQMAVPVDYSIEERSLVQRLTSFGVSEPQATEAIHRLAAKHGEACVIQGLDRMTGRRPANPVAYLTKTVENSAAMAAQSIPDYVDTAVGAAALPKAVRRHVRMPLGSQYEFIGWTCENHPRAKDGKRRKIWRTDSGSLKYHLPDAGEQVPNFTQDPGCYETD